MNNARVKRLQNVCEHYKDEKRFEDLRHLVDRSFVRIQKLNVMGCMIYKSGHSTLWEPLQGCTPF